MTVCLNIAILALETHGITGLVDRISVGPDRTLRRLSIFDISDGVRPEIRHFVFHDNYRVVFVTGPGVDVKIDWTLASPDPVDRGSLTPLIEAAFVASGTQSSPSTFEFEGRPGDPLDDPDSSIVVEGPIIGRSVILGRNRDIENYFPSEIIVYNNYYLYDLTNKERTEATGINNFTGLFVTDVDWISEE